MKQTLIFAVTFRFLEPAFVQIVFTVHLRLVTQYK